MNDNKEMIISGKAYKYTFCRKCGVWIETKNIHPELEPPHNSCFEYRKSRINREKATKRVLDLLNETVE